ncbi:hypothetical protein HX891_11535 [Pseudomonas reactans]|uniref:hypothetical protein n=1 Tax=Pseudomonas reactans TaxID=117680 RepID=UPI0015BE5BF3|nr:hypothetical protein [Pseudomonas reactans]NWD81005.1 hypothetical protein [Pseudomonas reactans]
MLNRIEKLIKRLILRLFFFTIFSLGSTIFFGTMHHYLAEKEFFYLATLCFPILAILFGFSALLYNRSRALPNGPAQRRSLYAAERTLQATILFASGLAIGAIIATLMLQFKIDAGGDGPGSKLLLIFIIPIMLILFSFGVFLLAFRAISHGMLKPVSIREMLKRVR